MAPTPCHLALTHSVPFCFVGGRGALISPAWQRSLASMAARAKDHSQSEIAASGSFSTLQLDRVGYKSNDSCSDCSSGEEAKHKSKKRKHGKKVKMKKKEKKGNKKRDKDKKGSSKKRKHSEAHVLADHLKQQKAEVLYLDCWVQVLTPQTVFHSTVCDCFE